MNAIRYVGQKSYELEVCGLKRQLPIIKVADDLWIASFVMMGDVQLVNICAAGLATRLAGYDFDIMVGPEAKVVPLLQSLSTIMAHTRYVVCRKSAKAYMKDPLIVEVESITTKGRQTLVLDSPDVARIREKRVAIVDDVVSTGGSIQGVEKLLARAGAQIVCRAAVLREGDMYKGDLIYLKDLPVFVP